MFESQASQGGHIRHSTFRARFILCEIRDLDWFVKTRVGIPTFNSESFELELNLGSMFGIPGAGTSEALEFRPKPALSTGVRRPGL